jgi:hypothetical protein
VNTGLSGERPGTIRMSMLWVWRLTDSPAGTKQVLIPRKSPHSTSQICARNAKSGGKLVCLCRKKGSRVSSGSIVSDYGLDDRAIGVRSPAGAENFSASLCVQTGSGAHPASCTMDTGGPFPGGKARPERDADHSPPSSAEVVNE